MYTKRPPSRAHKILPMQEDTGRIPETMTTPVRIQTVRIELKEQTTEAPLVARACMEELVTLPLLNKRITEELTTIV